MADFDIRAKTPLEQEISDVLRALEEEPHDAEKFGKLVRLANQYVHINPDDPDFQDCRFKAHQLCSKCQTNRDTDDIDCEREKALRFRIQTCMLQCLSFRSNKNRLLGKWLQGFYSAFNECVECYKGYLRAKSEIGPIFLHIFPEKNIENFLGFIEEWEEKCALTMMEERDITEGSEKKPLKISETYAVLSLAGVLAARDQHQGFYRILRSKRTKLRLTGLTEAPAGLLAFAIDEDQSTRSWAEMQAMVPPMSTEICTSKMVKKLLGQGIERKEWNGVAFLLKMAPDALKGSALPDTIMAHLSQDFDQSFSIFQFFQRMLDVKGSRLWESEDPEYPLVVLSTILDSTTYRSGVLKADISSDLLAWMKPFLRSLLPLALDGTTAEQTSDESLKRAGRAFEDALKKVTHFLIETMQQGNVQFDCRTVIFSHAVSLLQSFVRLEDHQEGAQVVAHSAQVAAQVATLHASLIANFALRGKVPNTMDIVPINSPERISALELLHSIFETDCVSLSESLLEFSIITVDLQAAYKKTLKISDRAELSTKLDELFQETAKKLDNTPWIASDLWRESYKAFRPSDDVGLFLQPLTSLSPFVQPQITSHVLNVKDSHQDKTSFVAYKDRVKACLLSLTRRLRSMRGNLPQVLLDISDENGIDVSSSHSLSTMCYQLTDGIIQANLCPEPDIYKAAQNIVRSTFEDAETRADCFRALLQCNPALALKGIEEYLESFLVAASTLVEANDAAKWMVRSFSDILDVLCSPTDGLLRVGTPHSLLDNASASSHVRRLFPSIWQLMSRSIAVIFKNTPRWSKIVPQADLTSWFRDVSLFASDLVEHVNVIQAAVVHGGSSDKDLQADILIDISIPLEEASSWFRMNDEQIVQETKTYFIKGLRKFKGSVKLPENVKERMLKFIDTQSKVEDTDSRMTLLTPRELSHLRDLLEPPAASVIEIDDSDSEDDIPLALDMPPLGKLTMGAKDKDSTRDLSNVTPSTQSAERKKIEEQHKLKQQKLSFQALASGVSRPFTSKPAPPKPAVAPPGPRFPTAASGSNRYQSATSRSSTASTTSHRPSGALAELRKNFTAASKWTSANRNISRPSYISSSRELPEPQAPAAKRTFAGATIDSHNIPTTKAPVAAEETESSDSDSEEEGAIGLADLIGQKKSPIKMRSKPKFQPSARRTVMVEDLEAQRRQREREEAERKRKLRERANLSGLNRSILSWDYFSETSRPPFSTNLPAVKYEAVRPVYKSPEEYVEVYGPMLLLEVWAEFQSARAEMERGGSVNPVYNAQVSARSATDSFVILMATVQGNVDKSGNLFSESDVYYLRVKGTDQAGQSAKTILAKVDGFRFTANGRNLTLRCCLESDKQGMTSLLVAGAQIQIGKLFSLTTIYREYDALQVMQYYDLLPSILQAKCAFKEVVSDYEVKQAEVDYGLNKPQAEAILSSLKAEQGFNLIEGPPGTGKTKTICSLVAHFIQTRRAPAAPIKAGQVGVKQGISKKILLCAPSNAAIDEVAKRVVEGVKLKNGKAIKPSIVRLGRQDVMNVAIKSFALDAIVQRKLASSTSNPQGETMTDVSQIHAEIRSLKDKRDLKRAELENARATKANSKLIAQYSSELQAISSARLDMMEKLDVVKDKKQTVDRQQNADKKRMEQEILSAADVVCTTLGGAGNTVFADLPFDFETVIIDEAAQAVELDTIIPLRYGCQRCILVGDPHQLPPTVISKEAERLHYSKSLFDRLFDNSRNHSHLLSIQYRMNPAISKFPSMEFYGGKLADGPRMAALTQKPWHQDSLLAPFRFFDCKNGQEVKGRGTSLVNRSEANLAVAIYERLRREAHRGGVDSVDGKVGVVTMYKDQVAELLRAFRKAYGQTIDEVVDFNTVDGFQGQEKDTIILSCVRTQGLGFLSDVRRVNVAITRAKSNLFIIGQVSNLERTTGIWPKFIDMARRENCLMPATVEMFQRSAVAIAPPAPAPTPIVAKTAASPSNGTAGSPTPPELSKKARKRAAKAKRKADSFLPLDVGQPPNKRAHIEPQRPQVPERVMDRPQAPRPINATPTNPVPNRPQPLLQNAAPPARPLPPVAPRPNPPPVRPNGNVNMAPRPPRPMMQRPLPQRPPPARSNPPNGGVLIAPPGPVANPVRPTPRPAQLNRPPPVHRQPVFSSQEGPSDKAKSSLFMPKSSRPARPKR